jgi:hypothetical protein
MGTSSKWKSKDNLCTRCLKNVESMTRVEQDRHEIECKKQEKLI